MSKSKSVNRLYTSFKPSHYDLLIRLNPEEMTFTGKVTVHGKKIGRPSSRLTFHQKSLRITKATIIKHGKKSEKDNVAITRINSHAAYDEVRIHTETRMMPGDYEVIMEFKGTITKPMDGIYPCFFEQDGRQKMLFATQFESHHAREAFPCIDEPEAKATFQLILDVPEGATSISNTPAKKEVTEAGRLTSYFEKTPVMSTYLLAFVTGEMAFKEAKTSSGILIRAFATRENANHVDFALETAVKCLDYFEDYFGIKYPLQKCDLIALPDFASGAMENWGCITFREQTMLVDDRHTSLTTKQFVALVVAHELAHQWFGNLVTMRWWTDLWLNEGFASWIEYLACDKLFPEWQLWTQFLVDEREQALKLDALDNTHPIEVPVRHPDEIRTIFDAISYNKGASVINMLHEYLGPEAFRDGLRHYLKRHAYSNTDTVDLWQALEEISKKPVKSFMHAWTSQPGFPLVSVEQNEEAVNISQSRFYLHAPQHHSKTAHWPVPLLRTHNGHEVLTASHAGFPYASHDDVLINRGHTGFYRAHYDSELIDEVQSLIKESKLGVTDRLGLLSDSFETAKAGKNKTADALTLLEAYENEDNAAVWDIIASSLAAVRTIMDDDSIRKNMKPYVVKLTAKQLKRLGWQKPDGGESHFDSLLRPIILAMSAVADEPEVVEKAKALFWLMHEPDDITGDLRESEHSVKRGTDIDPDLRGVVYGTVVRHGGEREFNKLLEMHDRATNSEERNTIAAALTGFKQAEFIDRALDKITSDSVRLQDVAYWVAYSFMNRFARDKTWDWMVSHWDWLKKNFEGDLGFYRMPVYAARSFSSPDFLKKYDEFFKDKMSPAFERSIKQGREIIEWHNDWRERDLDTIANYFLSARQS